MNPDSIDPDDHAAAIAETYTQAAADMDLTETTDGL